MGWVRGNLIGHGSFSTVNLALQKKQSSQFPQLMAVKSTSLSYLDMILREKSILDKFRECPQIIRCFGGEHSIEKGEETYNLFLEYAAGGTLADKMKKQSRRRLPEFEIQLYTRSILEGIKYIHDHGYVHCDIKLENILLCDHDAVKIADFGLARRAGEKGGPELRGTPLYMSPEALVAGGDLAAPADIWAIGCMVAEMVTGAPAWRCKPDTGVLRLLMRIGVGDELPEIPRDLSPEGRDFLEKIFTKDPAQRWTAQMLLEHPFLTCQFFEEASPRGPFDLINEAAQSPYSIAEIPLSDFDIWSSSLSDFDFDLSKTLQRLVTCQGPDWSITSGWIAVR